MITIVYASRAAHAMQEAELAELLVEAREYNTRHGVTGMLIYANASFMQALEGEEASVDALFAGIRRDMRHSDIRLLSRRQITTRSYEGWAMGFAHPDPEALGARLPGYRSTLRHPLVNSQIIVDSEIAELLLELCATAGKMGRR